MTAPLTLDEITGYARVLGVVVGETEDGTLIAVGTADIPTAVAALGWYLTDACVPGEAPEHTSSPALEWALIHGDPDDWDAHPAPAGTPGALPVVTLLT